jgi:4-hydroxy-3-methylbut-2-enyl diphosphate reductase
MDASQKLEDIVKVGDEIEAIVIKPNDAEGTISLSKTKIDAVKYFDEIEAAEAAGEILTGKVVEITRGGIAVLAKNVRVFIPISQTTLPRREEAYEEKDLQQFLGQTLEFKVIGTDSHKKRAVGSVRVVATEKKKAAEAKFWETAEVGQTFTGKVKSITSYGAFVDLGAVDGMVHITELSWKRIKNPTEVVNIGDEVTVFIKALDAEKKRISLGHRLDAENPWTILAEKYNVEDVVNVKIVSLTPFGAFAEVIPGIDGLIHISQLADKRVTNVKDVIAVGDEVKAKITEIDIDKKRISMSIRALLSNEEAAEEDAE